MKKHSTQKGYVAAILASILFGSSGLFVKLVQETGLDSISIIILQNLIAVPTLWAMSLILYKDKLKISKALLGKLLIHGGLLNNMVTLFYYQSLKYLHMSVATILLFCYPIFITLYAFIFSKEKPNKIIIIPLFIAFSGCILVLDLFHINNSIAGVGILYGIGAALAYGCFNLFVESMGDELPPLVIATYSSSFALLAVVLYRFPLFLFEGNISSFQIFIISLMTYITQIPPVILLYMAIQYIGAIKTSIIGNIEIPSAAILGYIFYGETLNLIQFMGVLLVICGILFMKNTQFLASIFHLYFYKIYRQKQ